MVNLKVVKNDSYEKGNDLMVVNVYMKGICRDTARVIFREQDFTLIFQTRYGIKGSTCKILLTLQHEIKHPVTNQSLSSFAGMQTFCGFIQTVDRTRSSGGKSNSGKLAGVSCKKRKPLLQTT